MHFIQIKLCSTTLHVDFVFLVWGVQFVSAAVCHGSSVILFILYKHSAILLCTYWQRYSNLNVMEVSEASPVWYSRHLSITIGASRTLSSGEFWCANFGPAPMITTPTNAKRRGVGASLQFFTSILAHHWVVASLTGKCGKVGKPPLVRAGRNMHSGALHSLGLLGSLRVTDLTCSCLKTANLYQCYIRHFIWIKAYRSW